MEMMSQVPILPRRDVIAITFSRVVQKWLSKAAWIGGSGSILIFLSCSSFRRRLNIATSVNEAQWWTGRKYVASSNLDRERFSTNRKVRGGTLGGTASSISLVKERRAVVKSMLAEIEYTTARLVTSLYYMTIDILASKTEFLWSYVKSVFSANYKHVQSSVEWSHRKWQMISVSGAFATGNGHKRPQSCQWPVILFIQ